MQVEVSGRQFIFPSLCACCGTHSETSFTVSASKSTGKKKVRTETHTWDFPYCTCCIKHVNAESSAASLSCLIVIATVIVVGYLIVNINIFWLSIFLSVGIIAAAIWIISKLYAQAQLMRNANCCCLSKAVDFLSWDGTHQIFEITSHKYALAFMIANKQKLINISSKAKELLESNGHGSLPNTPQASRRYIQE